MENFRKEVENLSTEDIMLILEDQQDLYSDEELAVLTEELHSRPSLEEQARLDEEERVREEECEREKKRRAAYEARIENLRQRGYDGYYEYMTLSLIDNDGGDLNASQVVVTLNEHALDGWRLVSAYANELGHNSSPGFISSTNSTIDQHILILERFIKI